MEPRSINRYSLSFKHQVINELESGRFGSIMEAQRHYGITGAETIRNWLHRYGKTHLCPKVVRVEKPNEASEIRQLKKKIQQLEQALGRTQADNVLNETFLEIACEALGQDVEAFKKKVGIEASIRPVPKDPGSASGDCVSERG
jgi:transposase-like protein